jgi:serine/threonine-protein kinase ATR
MSNLPDHERHAALNALGRLSCAGAECLKESNGLKGTPKTFQCTICDARSPLAFNSALKSDIHAQSKEQHISESISQLIKCSRFQRHSDARISLALAIRRIVNHVNAPTVIDLGTSAMGQWCLRSLQSSLRELRIAAA